jgi:catechol 2,3-dioxygenase-like lactoylglutathione lyase family enzyme
MAKLASICPCFIVANLNTAVSFYLDKLGFKVLHAVPADAPFFAMVGRDDIAIMLKEIAPDILPVPNNKRHPWARWDAYIYTPEPDALFDEYVSAGVSFSQQIQDTGDGLRGFELEDANGYVLFFGRPI